MNAPLASSHGDGPGALGGASRARRITAWLRGESLSATIYRGAGFFLAIQIVGTLMTFGLNVLLARLLGVDGYGVYAYAATWLATLLIFCNAGWNTSTLRYVASYRVQKEWGLLRGFLRTARVSTVLASLLTAVTLFAATVLLNDRIGSSLAATLRVVALALPFSALLFLSSSTLRSLKWVGASQVPLTIGLPLLVGGGLVLASRSSSGPPSPTIAMSLHLAASAILVATSEALAARALPREVRSEARRYDRPGWRQVTIPLFMVAIVQLGLSRVDVLLLGAFAPAREVGLYSSAARMGGFLTFGIAAVNAWVAPMIAEMYVEGRRAELARVVRIGTVGILAFSIPGSFVVLVFGRDLLSLFGAEFVEAYPALAILVAGQLVHSTMGVAGFLLTMTLHQRDAVVIDGASATLAIALGLALIPTFGAVGAALTSAVTIAARSVAVTAVAWMRLGIRATIV